MSLKNIFLLTLAILCYLDGFSQASQDSLDLKYREDQFYIGVTYNLLRQMPQDMAQNGFSSGFQLGFIRDMPINEKRTVAIGLGVGISSNSINQNLKITEADTGGFDYEIVSNEDFTKNKYSLYMLEIPFEFRWRNSTPELYKFFRIYPGIKVAYIFANSVKFQGNPKDFKISPFDDFNRWQVGLTLSAGYDKFNLHAFYSLNSLFTEDAQLNGQPIDVSLFKVGLLLYIL